jgi:hypothetical protein
VAEPAGSSLRVDCRVFRERQRCESKCLIRGNVARSRFETTSRPRHRASNTADRSNVPFPAQGPEPKPQSSPAPKPAQQPIHAPVNPDPKSHPIHPAIPTQPIHEGGDPSLPVTGDDRIR